AGPRAGLRVASAATVAGAPPQGRPAAASGAGRRARVVRGPGEAGGWAEDAPGVREGAVGEIPQTGGGPGGEGEGEERAREGRGADIVAYQELADRILKEGGDPVVLRTNFRSHAKILDLVNATFSRVIVENKKLQPRYERIEPAVDAVQKYPDPTLEAVLIEDA